MVGLASFRSPSLFLNPVGAFADFLIVVEHGGCFRHLLTRRANRYQSCRPAPDSWHAD
jgi:hypothetical protein